MPVVALGASDCEALRDGWLGQPVNGLSSLAYVVAGAYVLHRGGPRARGVAVALGAVGIGSVLYHGPMPPGAEPAHDWSIVGLGAVVLATWSQHRFRRPPGATLLAFGAALAVNVLTRTGEPLCRPDSLLQGHAVWHVLTALAVAWWFAPRGGRWGDLPTHTGATGEPVAEPVAGETLPGR